MILTQKIEENTSFLRGLFGGPKGKVTYRVPACGCLKIMMKGNLFLKHVVKTHICNFIIHCLITVPYNKH